MSKKNLPNIPIYIGDWERDCNVLSLEAEGGWMRIVFKLWTKGKSNAIKMTTKSLQNLWRCDEQQMIEIIQELLDNEICEIVLNNEGATFTCRRFVRENRISEIRSKAGSSKKNKNQNVNKSEQMADNDNDNESILSKNKLSEYKSASEKIDLKTVESKLESLLKTFGTEIENGGHDTMKEMARKALKLRPSQNLNPFLKSWGKQFLLNGELPRNTIDMRKHFVNWCRKQPTEI